MRPRTIAVTAVAFAAVAFTVVVTAHGGGKGLTPVQALLGKALFFDENLSTR